MTERKSQESNGSVATWEWLLLGTMIAIGGIIRFWMAATAPGLWYDEAINGLDALSLGSEGGLPLFFDTGNHVREPLYIYLELLGIWSFGTTAFAIRCVSSLIGTLTLPMIWLLAREYRGAHFAAMVLVIFTFLRWHIHFSGLAFRTILAPFFLCGALLFLFRSYRRANLYDALIAGAFLGGGAYTYLAFRLIPLALLPPLLIWLWRSWRESSHLLMATLKLQGCFVGGAAVVFLPLAIHFVYTPSHFTGRSDEVSFFSQENAGQLIVKQARDVAMMPLLRGDHVGKHNLPGPPTFLQPAIIDTEEVAALWQQERADAQAEGRAPMDPHGTGMPALTPVAGVAFYAGFIILLFRLHRRFDDQVLLSVLLIGSLSSILSFGAPNMLRLLIITPIVSLVIGRGFEPISRLFRPHAKMHDWDEEAFNRRQIIGTRLAIAAPFFLIALTSIADLFRLAQWHRHPMVAVEFNAEWRELGDVLREQPDRLPVRLPLAPPPTLQYLAYDYPFNPPQEALDDRWWEFRPNVNFGGSWEPVGESFPAGRSFPINHPQGFQLGVLTEVRDPGRSTP